MAPEDLIVQDELMHNSAIVGAKLSRATSINFRHNDLDDLEEVLRENRANHKKSLIVAEGLYSMDGDFPDLPRLVEIKKRYGAWLMIDEAGTSVSASRLVAGERILHRELESELANFYGADACLAFVSGHATNISTIGIC